MTENSCRVDSPWLDENPVRFAYIDLTVVETILSRFMITDEIWIYWNTNGKWLDIHRYPLVRIIDEGKVVTINIAGEREEYYIGLKWVDKE